MSWKTISFRKRMLIIMTLSGLIELLLLVAAGFTYLKINQEQEMGEKALGVARFLADSAVVREMIETQNPQPYQLRFRELTEAIGAAFIVIGDHKGVRLIHPVDERLGKPMRGGDNRRALEQGLSYVSTAQGSLGYSVRGKAAIFDEQGSIIGVVSVGYLLDRLQDRIEPFLAFLILMVIVVVVANAIVSNYASRKFQRAILGFEPEEIGRLYGELEVTMSTIKEGVLSIDAQGILRSINRSACQILGIDRESALNKPLTEAVCTWASWDQRGFIPGRMMVDNVIEIDTHGRIASMAAIGGERTPKTKRKDDLSNLLGKPRARSGRSEIRSSNQLYWCKARSCKTETKS